MTAPPHPSLPVEVGLTAAIVAVRDDDPMILVIEAGEGSESALPSGPFDPLAHRTFEIGLRAWVSEQTGSSLGYVEQLYTFGDRGRNAQVGDRDPHIVSVGYLALTRVSADRAAGAFPLSAGFRPWYHFFPWEDWRGGRPVLLDHTIIPALTHWARMPEAPRATARMERVRAVFGIEGTSFNEENVLERYELLYEAGLVPEAGRDGRRMAAVLPSPILGVPMRHDHRRVLATAMGRLRAKMKYRPVIFELMPASFSLTALQRTAGAISGLHLHKQNFRRLVEASAIVEPTGEMSHATGGRPAALFRFRREAVQERPAQGLRVGVRG